MPVGNVCIKLCVKGIIMSDKCINCAEKETKKKRLLNYFCSVRCAKEFANDCADHRVRRLGHTLVRYKKGDKRL